METKRWKFRLISVLLCSALYTGWALHEMPTVRGDDATYITVKKCMMCHRKQYNTYKDTKHAQVKPAADESTALQYRHSTGFDGKAWAQEGVGCEACHGPGSLHMRATGDQRKATIVRPAELSPQLQADICGQCHASGKTADGKDYPEGFKPGMELSKVITTFDEPKAGDPFTVYNAWMKSKHHDKQVVCITCHDPHGTGPDGQPHQLRKAPVELCGGCHKEQSDIKKHQPEAPAGATCITCHMPQGSHAFTKEAAQAGKKAAAG